MVVGGIPMVNQPKPKKVEVAQKLQPQKKDKKSLQEIYPQPEDDDGFDEEHSDGVKNENVFRICIYQR